MRGTSKVTTVYRESSWGLKVALAMADEFDRAKELFEWNERVFAVMGEWPLHSTYARFSLWVLYFLIHMTTLLADLFSVLGDLDLMVENLLESSWHVMTILKLLVMRFSRTLAKLTNHVIESIDRKNFHSSEEIEIYLSYNRIAKTFFKLWLIAGVFAAIVYNSKALSYRIRAGLQNESVAFVLSYRTRFFFDVKDSTTFWLVWIYQSPVMCFNISQAVTIGYMFSLILHVCGTLSVLSFRIRNLDLKSRESRDFSKLIFRDILANHRNALGMIGDINGVFGLLLLEELIIMTLLIGLSSYSVLTNANFEEPGILLASFFYDCTLLLMIYGYCLAGEYLVVESMNLYEAYYQCLWYNMSGSFKKQLIICMIGASKPTQLTAGGFYNFSLESFTNVLKTAAGYISLLRAI